MTDIKRVLITGKDSYIGKSIENWLMREPGNYLVDTVEMKDVSWKTMDFSLYDVVFHVAGIAHIRESSDNHELYYKVNRDLAYETAQKAKESGVGQIIFLSSMSVYGMETGIIDQCTPLKSNTAYGKSKIQAEELINRLADQSFTVSIIRPPMVYGKGCRGNYTRLAKLARKMPIFPKIDNNRSMIYIDNLSEFVKQLIDNRCGGVFFPQNTEYVNTSELFRMIAEVHGKKVVFTKLFNPLLGSIKVSTLNKVFGDLIYDLNMSEFGNNYRVCEFSESIKRTEE